MHYFCLHGQEIWQDKGYNKNICIAPKAARLKPSGCNGFISVARSHHHADVEYISMLTCTSLDHLH